MTSIAEFTLPAAGFPLGRVFEDSPDVTLELDRVVPNADTVMPYFWVHRTATDGSLAAIRDRLDGLPELRSVVLMEDLGDRGLYRAEWKPEYMGIMRAIAETGVTVLSATGSREGWTFELRAPTVDRFSAFHRHCTDHGIDVTLARLTRLSETTTGAGYDLTAAQHEALVHAYEEGYFDVPRETDMESLATHFGISRQALSARLRRGNRNLIRTTLIHGGEADAS